MRRFLGPNRRTPNKNNFSPETIHSRQKSSLKPISFLSQKDPQDDSLFENGILAELSYKEHTCILKLITHNQNRHFR